LLTVNLRDSTACIDLPHVLSYITHGFNRKKADFRLFIEEFIS